MKLMEVRRVRRLSIEELAVASGIAATTIASIEASKTTPRMATVRKLEKALDVDGQMIEEFWATLGEPTSRYLRQLTPEKLAASIARAEATQKEIREGTASFVGREKLHQQMERPAASEPLAA